MFLGRVNDWVSVVGTDIPFITEMNTNSKISNDNGLIRLKKAAVWNIDASVVLSGLADSGVIVSVWADGVETGAFAEATVTADGFVTVPITDAIKTAVSRVNDYARISLRVDTAGVTVSGTLKVSYVQ